MDYLLACRCALIITTIDGYLWNHHAGDVARLSFAATITLSSHLGTRLLFFLLMGQDLFLMLLEADEVEVEVLDTVLLQQVLSDQTAQVDACLSERVILIKG